MSQNEFELIKKLTALGNRSREDVKMGIGDDCAAVEISKEQLLLFTCDAQVESIHYFKDKIAPRKLGERLASVNLSDIAAMGGTPCWALCSLFVSNNAESDFMTQMYEGLYSALEQFNVQLIGGNIAKNHERFIADLFLVGKVCSDEMLTRSGALPGDVICVTGTLGDSYGGHLALVKELNGSEVTSLIERHVCPTARIEVGRVLAESGAVTGCMDISDGLIQDASHMANASDVNLSIDADSLPISKELIQFSSSIGEDAKRCALMGGEDYELLFTVKKESVSSVLAAVKEQTGVKVTPIGTVQQKKDRAKRNIEVSSFDINKLNIHGFDHLK